MKLKFFVDGQRLLKHGKSYVVADSKNYLYAEFLFSQEWATMAKTAIFKSPDEAYTVVIEDGMCKVPYEVMGADFAVSVFGTDGDVRITTDYIEVSVEESGYIEGETPQEPTPTVYEQLASQATDAVETAYEAKAAVDGKADVSMLGEKADREELLSHTSNLTNPHSVTKAQLGLSNVDNTADKSKPISDAVANALLQKASVAEVESVRVEAETAWQKATTTAGALEQLNREFFAHVSGNNEALSVINEAIKDLDATHKTDIAALDEKCNTNSANIEALSGQVGDISVALDEIIALQNSLIGGDSV